MCFVFFACLLVSVSEAVTWTSGGSIANGTAIPACSGQDVTLAWTYYVSAEEHLMNMEWHYKPTDGGSEVLIATEVMGNFFVAPGTSQNIQFIPSAGIRLQNVAMSDSGTYSVHVNINLHGSVVSEVQTVDVVVSDDALTTDGQLHVEMLPDAVYDNSTQQFHVQLACGQFKPVWESRVAVLWKTPSNQTLPSSSVDNGRFLLSVPNPVISGEYTCAIDDASPASLCVQSGSPVRRGSTYAIDGMEARFTVMESRMKAMEENYKQENSALKQEIATLTQDNQILREQLQSNITDFASRLDLTTKSVSFHTKIDHYITWSAGRILLGDVIYVNQGDAYDKDTGYFSAPVNGTYLLMFSMVTSSSSPYTKQSQVNIKIDSIVVNSCFSSWPQYTKQGACQAVRRMWVGQKAYLENVVSGYMYADSYFSGALLHAEV